MRYFFHIGYHGTFYKGWQRSPQIQTASVQYIIETRLTSIVKAHVPIFGCGRTDSHVHASQFFFHADFDEAFIPEMMFRLNKNLPDDIAVFDIIPMDNTVNARLSATQRTYNYFIHRYKDPFLHNKSALYAERDLNLEQMKMATTLLARYKDYRLFYRTASKPRTTICKVTHSDLFVDHTGDRLKFTISANRFLSGMVRVIVHKLLEVGRNRLTVEQFENYLKGTETPKDIKSAYPQGLYLAKVIYPFLDMPPRPKFVHMIDRESDWKPI